MTDNPLAEDDRPWPQEGYARQILPAPVGRIGTGQPNPEPGLVAKLDAKTTVMMMGDNPALPRMPKAPTLMDFFRLRFDDFTVRHLVTSGARALQAGMDEKVVLACLLHDISNGCMIRTDHGYWGAQMVAPYVDEEVAWAIQMHQPLRYFADEANGYPYPESYKKFFGPDYVPPEYIRKDAEAAKNHRWYMTARQLTIYDIYFFDDFGEVDLEMFTDVIGRHFRQPKEGLGFDNSPTAHMWRTMIWPNNFL